MITGTGFLAGATVKLGGTAASNVVVVSGTSITATTAAHGAGVVDVVVTNSDTQSGTLSQGYRYTASNPAPTVTGITPSSGSRRWRDRGDDHGYGISGGSRGEAGRYSGEQCGGGEQHVDHGHDCGARGRSGGRGGDQ